MTQKKDTSCFILVSFYIKANMYLCGQEAHLGSSSMWENSDYPGILIVMKGKKWKDHVWLGVFG